MLQIKPCLDTLMTPLGRTPSSSHYSHPEEINSSTIQWVKPSRIWILFWFSNVLREVKRLVFIFPGLRPALNCQHSLFSRDGNYCTTLLVIFKASPHLQREFFFLKSLHSPAWEHLSSFETPLLPSGQMLGCSLNYCYMDLMPLISTKQA